MGSPERLRDSTQIVVPLDALESIEVDIAAEYAVTVEELDQRARIVGSPVVIKEVGERLARHGVSMR